jgi:hypothetical protein
VNPGPGVLGLRIFKMASFFRLKRRIELTLLSAKPIPDFFSRTNETHEISLSLFFSRKGVGFANQKKNLGSSFANQKETHIDSPHYGCRRFEIFIYLKSYSVLFVSEIFFRGLSVAILGKLKFS